MQQGYSMTLPSILGEFLIPRATPCTQVKTQTLQIRTPTHLGRHPCLATTNARRNRQIHRQPSRHITQVRDRARKVFAHGGGEERGRAPAIVIYH